MSKNKTTIAITIVLMLSTTMFTTLLSNVTAQDSITVQTFAYLAYRPNPIGVGQTLLLNMWLTPPTDWPGIPYHDYTLKITDPDGQTETIGPMQSKQADSSHWYEYKPEKVGTYKLQFIYPGETVPIGTPYESYNPPFPIVGYTTYEVTYLGSESPITELVVTEEQVPGYEPTPLPAEYWTRPVSLENREWSTLLGDWPQVNYDDSRSNFQPYGTAPNTAHILWVKQWGVTGQVGGQYNYSVYSSPQYTAAYVDEDGFHGRQRIWTTVYEIKWAIGGLGFYSENGRLHAVDLRNGEEVWVKEGISIDALKNEEYITRAQGVPIVGYTPYILDFGSTYRKYAAATGDLICEVPGLRANAYDNNRYAYSVQNLGGQRYLVKWDTHDIMENFTRRIVYNVTYPLNGNTGIWNDVGFYFGSGPAGTELEQSIALSGAFDLATGNTRWVENLTYSMIAFSGSAAVLADGKYIYAMYIGDDDSQGMRLLTAIDLYTGNQEWLSEAPDYPWGSLWSYSTAAAYGLAYFPNYAGYIYAFNTDTGEIEWKGGHSGPTGYETPYGWQPFFSSILVADGKVYAGNNEHSEGPPYYKGKKLWALDAQTGETLWNIEFWLPGFGIQAIVADGMFIGTNYYDGRSYAFGKGPSATTVAASPKVSVHGSSVVVEGMITDISPAAEDPVVKARFPHGVPVMSDEDMSAWMEYLYMQMAKPTEAVGVEVTVSVLDPNNNVYDVAVATSDDNGYYSATFVPEVPGDYKIIARFAGSESYYGSVAETFINVEEAPAPTPEAAAEAGSMADLYLIPSTIGIIVAIVVVGLVLVLMLRKREAASKTKNLPPIFSRLQYHGQEKWTERALHRTC